MASRKRKRMATQHPYVQAPKHLSECIARFRRSLPPTVNASTLQKHGIASNNERYVLNTLRFLGLLDDEGKPTEAARDLFTRADDENFRSRLSEIIESHYVDLFQVRGDDAWTLNRTDLVTYFRGNDQTSLIVGNRQASTFQVLSELSGHSAASEPSRSQTRPKADQPTKRPKVKNASASHGSDTSGDERLKKSDADRRDRPIGLTVRIEINLPAGGDQATYDNIFQSIRKNLINE